MSLFQNCLLLLVIVLLSTVTAFCPSHVSQQQPSSATRLHESIIEAEDRYLNQASQATGVMERPEVRKNKLAGKNILLFRWEFRMNWTNNDHCKFFSLFALRYWPISFYCNLHFLRSFIRLSTTPEPPRRASTPWSTPGGRKKRMSCCCLREWPIALSFPAPSQRIPPWTRRPSPHPLPWKWSNRPAREWEFRRPLFRWK